MGGQCLALVRTSNPVQLKPRPIHPSHTNSSLPPYPIHSGVVFPSPPPRQSSTTTVSASLPAALLPLRPSSLPFIAARELPARPTFGKLAGDRGAFAIARRGSLVLGTCGLRFMTFMSYSAVSSNGIALRLLVEERIRRRSVCACEVLALGSQRRRMRHPVVFAKKRRRPKKWQRPWWKTFFSDWNDDDESLSGLREDDELFEEIGSYNDMMENEKFDTWKRKAEALVELREAQQDSMNAEERLWEDWISGGSTSGGGDWGGGVSVSDQITDDPGEIVKDKSFIETFRDSIDEDYDDMLFEDRVFMYASTKSAKFLALLILVPWVIDFLFHDYVMMPFLERYVQKVPLAAELLDVRRSQKLQMVHDLKIEKARYRFEVEIGKSPPLSEEEVWFELREKAIELRDDWRLENRRAFANILSDMVFGIVLFLLICFNQSKVAMLKFTGYKLLNNISDSGKAFLIILVSDILLGYHSESGWHTLSEVILEHYGFEVDQAAITFFVCLVPVALDVLIKFWVYKYLPRLSPSVGNILDEIKRH